MGINLRDYVKDVNELLTEEEAERLFIAAGYVKISEGEEYKPVYLDCDGTEIVDGSKFIYKFNRPDAITGHVRMEDDELWVFWDDGLYSGKMEDFWFDTIDEKITKVTGNIHE